MNLKPDELESQLARLNEEIQRLQQINKELQQQNESLLNKNDLIIALRESEERQRIINENSIFGVVLAANDGKFLSTNRAFCDMVGYTNEELATMHFVDITDPQDLTNEMSLFQKLISCEIEYYKIEKRYITKNQQAIWVLANITCYRNEQGEIEYFIGVVENINEQKNAERDLKENQKFTLAVLDLIGNLLVVLDKEGRIVKFNKACELTTGYSFAEVENISFFDLFIIENEDTTVGATFNKLLTGDFPCEMENFWKTKDGNLRFIHWTNSCLLDNKGNVSYIISSGLDITEKMANEKELEESHQKYKVLFDAFPLGITISDKEGNIIESNKISEKLLEIPKDEHENRAIHGAEWQIIKTDGSPFEPDEFASVKALKENRLVENVEMGIVKSKGQITWINVTATPIPLENFGVAIVYNDITEKKRIEAELIKAKTKAEESDMLKTAFLQNMSHEIRTPLNSIVGFVGLLDNSNLPAERRKFFIDRIRQNSNDLLLIINEVLDISKIAAGQLEISEIATSIKQVFLTIKYVYERYRNQQNKSSIQFSVVNRLPDENTVILTDYNRLQQILENLVENAFKFTNEGSVELGVSLNVENNLLFYVKDTGIGISEEKLVIVFELFRQADEGVVRKYGGNGLGLSLVKGLVELLGGEIWVESKLGEGSTFYFTIPYKTVPVKSEF